MPPTDWDIAEQDQFIAEAIERDEPRLRNFIRRQVLDSGETEDILQEVFYELIEAYRLMKPIEQVSAWLFRVARNRITDRFRRRKQNSLSEPVLTTDNSEAVLLEDLLPSPEAGPDAVFARNVLMEALEEALDELPPEQREVFIAHELMEMSFKDISAKTGVGVNTLLSRKRYAVLQLRQRLKTVYEDFVK